MWKRLTHPNILSLLGVTITPKFQLVSNWMPGGDLPGYIQRNPNVDLLKLVGAPPISITLCLLSLSAIGRRKWPPVPPLLQCGSWRPQGSMWSF